jgi:hypothetical protein
MIVIFPQDISFCFDRFSKNTLGVRPPGNNTKGDCAATIFLNNEVVNSPATSADSVIISFNELSKGV